MINVQVFLVEVVGILLELCPPASLAMTSVSLDMV